MRNICTALLTRALLHEGPAAAPSLGSLSMPVPGMTRVKETPWLQGYLSRGWIYIYVYIYTHDTYTYIHICICVYVYRYIYVYRGREALLEGFVWIILGTSICAGLLIAVGMHWTFCGSSRSS